MREPVQSVKLPGIQYLRAIAALMVAYLHMSGQILQYSPTIRDHLPFDIHQFNSAVDIFFVISGFIMMISSASSSPGDFAIRRVIRVVPLYWIVTLTLAGLYVVAPTAFRTMVVRPEYVLKSLLFIPYHNPGAWGERVPLLVPGWTLNLEMFFYATFTFALFTPYRWRLALIALIFTCLLAVGEVSQLQTNFTVVGFYMTPRILEFWLGMLIGDLYLRNRLGLPRVVSWLLIFGGFGFLLAGWPVPYALSDRSAFASLLPAVAIVLGAVGIECDHRVRYHWFPALLGDASYSIYLTHFLSLELVRALWIRIFGNAASPEEAIGFATCSMIAVCAVAILAYRLIERPLLRVGHRMFVQHA